MVLRIAPDSLFFTVLLGLLAALPALSIDISVPTLPVLPQVLGASTTVVGLTISFFMVGFALGQLITGSLSDRVGRRPAVLAALAGYTIAGIGCLISPSAPALVTARLFQGIGAGSCAVVSFAMVQDLFKGDAARAKRAYVTVVLAAAPIVAPSLGSLVSALAGWRAVYGVLGFAGAVLLAVVSFGLQESLDAGRSISTALNTGGERRLWKDRLFIGYALANAVSYGGVFAYIAGAATVIVTAMGLSYLVVAGVFAGTATALTAGAWTSGRLSRRGYSARAIVGTSLAVAAVATLALATLSLSAMIWPVWLLPPLLLAFFSRGLIAPNLQHLAIERWPDRAGAASAAVGVSQLASGALASVVVSFFLAHHGSSAVAVPMAVLALVALIIWLRT